MQKLGGPQHKQMKEITTSCALKCLCLCSWSSNRAERIQQCFPYKFTDLAGRHAKGNPRQAKYKNKYIFIAKNDANIPPMFILQQSTLLQELQRQIPVSPRTRQNVYA